jgi:hypothetical protein
MLAANIIYHAFQNKKPARIIKTNSKSHSHEVAFTIDKLRGIIVEQRKLILLNI